ncbi:MAG: hypothetical protein K0R25_631 [Rickettsiaceae bacterium]|nr:hypothetical protein [Rickettsiaceae bacterium]
MALLRNSYYQEGNIIYIDPYSGLSFQQVFHNLFINFNWILFSEIGAAVAIFIVICGIYKRFQLASGGKAIAIEMGVRMIWPDTTNFQEKQLLNIVTEMSIASGIAVPPVYILKEDGINAFAAGFAARDAIICVTSGAIENLNREELQGVIAHEFSHIFNGDARLNINLIAILHGILVIGMAGYFLVRDIHNRIKVDLNNHSAQLSSIITYRNRRYGRLGSETLIIPGFILMIVGYVGTFFGNLIKASVSRKREALADASAVQFTRNPFGLAGALKKIGGCQFGSKITNAKAPEISHMFFAPALDNALSSLMATHPPLEKRILEVDPYWDGQFIQPTPKTFASDEEIKNNNSIDKRSSIVSLVGAMVQTIGVIDEELVKKAHNLTVSIPQFIKDSTSNTFGARAIIYSLILMKEESFYQQQLEILKNNSEGQVLNLVQKLSPQIHQLAEKYYIALISLCIPVLKQLSPFQYQNFKRNIELLVGVDSKTNFFEWMLIKILSVSLEGEFDKNNIPVKASYNLNNLEKEVSLFLSLLIHKGTRSGAKAIDNFKEAMADKKDADKFYFIDKSEITISKLDEAIKKLEKLYPLEKQKLLSLCIACIVQDQVLISEIELFRAFCMILDCPMPLIA